MPIELTVLAAVFVLIAALGVPVITRAVWLPRELSFREVEDEQLSAKQLAYFLALDNELAALGYRPRLSFEVSNLQGGNLTRVYQSDQEPAVVAASCLRGESAVPGAPPTAENYVEWVTRHDDGTILTTRNVSISDLFELMPHEIRQECPGESSLERLKRRHDLRAEELRVRGPRFPHGRDLLAEFQEHHDRWCAFQESKGLLKFDPERLVYRARAKAAWRGVANFLNPMADNFTLRRFALGLILGAGLPVLGVLGAERPELVRVTEMIGVAPKIGAWVLLGLSFSAGGAAVGALFTSKSLVWALLLGYVPIRLLGADISLELLLVLWMGVVAEQVSAMVHKRRLLV